MARALPSLQSPVDSYKFISLTVTIVHSLNQSTDIYLTGDAALTRPWGSNGEHADTVPSSRTLYPLTNESSSFSNCLYASLLMFRVFCIFLIELLEPFIQQKEQLFVVFTGNVFFCLPFNLGFGGTFPLLQNFEIIYSNLMGHLAYDFLLLG